MIQTIDATKLYKEYIKTESENYMLMVEVKLNFKWHYVGHYPVNPTIYTIKKIKDKIYLMPNRYQRFLLTDEAIDILQLNYLKNDINIKYNLSG